MDVCFFFFKQKTAYEMRISDWSSDVCSSDLRSLDQGIGRPRPAKSFATAGEGSILVGWNSLGMAVRAFFLPMLSRIAGILLRTHLRERFDESTDVPDRRLFICSPDRRHAAHLHALVAVPVSLLMPPAFTPFGHPGRLCP